jgi:hypothetical protein
MRRESAQIALEIRGNGVRTWENGGTNTDGPGPAALTAGGSQGLADEALRSVD